VAYWTTLLTVAIRTTGYHNDYPTLLIIDTPQLALNAQVPLNNAVYHRLSTQQDVGKRGEVIRLAIMDLPRRGVRETSTKLSTNDPRFRQTQRDVSRRRNRSDLR
jgi:hypothetical protein